MDSSLPGPSVHGDSPGKNTEWVAMPSSGDPANPGIEPKSPALWVDSLPAELPGKTLRVIRGPPTVNPTYLQAGLVFQFKLITH